MRQLLEVQILGQPAVVVLAMLIGLAVVDLIDFVDRQRSRRRRHHHKI